MFIRRLRYGLSSLPALFRGVRNKRAVLKALFGAPGGDPLTIELHDSGLRVKVRSLLDILIIKEVCLDRSYLDPDLELRQDCVFIDIGACFGAFAIDAGRRHPNAMVFAYEPFPPSFDLLNANVQINRLANVRTFPYAVGGGLGNRKLDLDPRGALRHRTVPP